MPDPIAAVPGATVSPTGGVNPLDLYAAPNPGLDQNSAIDQEAFLKLLVAQLKYQDPLEPTSNEEFISLTAQFTTVERLNELADQGRSRTTNEALNTAGALVGRTISFLGELGMAVQARVDQATVIGGDVRLLTDRGSVSLDQIIAIGAPAATANPDTTEPVATANTDITEPSATTNPDTTEPSATTQANAADPSPTTTPSQEATVQ
ncbi:MAG: hypothetical protein OES24_13805 [Acidimicrobiia bacterium]|nr:hypothetical protein [Acidimicrobiia bacterium]